VLDLADQMKKNGFGWSLLAGSRAVAVLFDRQSPGSRVSVTVGITELGGLSPLCRCVSLPTGPQE
jgi:ornithine carbamoyltransferase